MHIVLAEIITKLDELVVAIDAVVPAKNTFAQGHGNWQFPAIGGEDLKEKIGKISGAIRSADNDQLTYNPDLLAMYPARLEYLKLSTVPQLWSNPAQAVSAFSMTLDSLYSILDVALDFTLLEEARTVAGQLRNTTKRIRGIEATVKGLEPRSAAVGEFMDQVERAHEAATNLPVDLELLAEARAELARVAKDVDEDRIAVALMKKEIAESVEKLAAHETDAKKVLESCSSAYAAATSQGLASAFAERSKSLDASTRWWILGLVVSLVVGGVLGYFRIQDINNAVKQQEVASLLVSCLLSIFAVGGPIWFAWLATKQIGQRFRLAEDYAFKAAVSKAYEGYSREAKRLDSSMETDLLRSALSRLDEQPLRLVEAASHGSPGHEFMNSGLISKAWDAVPGFRSRVEQLASDGLDALRSNKTKVPLLQAEQDGSAASQ